MKRLQQICSTLLKDFTFYINIESVNENTVMIIDTKKHINSAIRKQMKNTFLQKYQFFIKLMNIIYVEFENFLQNVMLIYELNVVH